MDFPLANRQFQDKTPFRSSQAITNYVGAGGLSKGKISRSQAHMRVYGQICGQLKQSAENTKSKLFCLYYITINPKNQKLGRSKQRKQIYHVEINEVKYSAISRG